MKLSVLMENTARSPEFFREHGLSLFVETENRRILFDMGQTDRFAENAARMHVPLETAELAVLSHGHYDHGGGLKRFLQLNRHAPVYVSPYAFEPHFSGPEKDIGLDRSLQGEPRLLSGRAFPKDSQLELTDCAGLEIPFPANPFGLYTRRDGKLIPEDFRHEQYLIVHEKGRRIVFSGCSHRGILNIVRWLKPDVLIGGFHFKKLDPHGEGRETLSEAARLLLESGAMFYTGHCTGEEQGKFLKGRMGSRLELLSAGDVLDL